MGKIIVFLFSLTRESGYLSYLGLPNSHFQRKKIIDDFFLIELAIWMAFLCRGNVAVWIYFVSFLCWFYTCYIKGFCCV